MSCYKNEIIHWEHWWKQDRICKKSNVSRKKLKRSLNRYMRRLNKLIDDNEIGYKTNRKPTRGLDY